jgi:hypothetical protein
VTFDAALYEQRTNLVLEEGKRLAITTIRLCVPHGDEQRRAHHRDAPARKLRTSAGRFFRLVPQNVASAGDPTCLLVKKNAVRHGQ